MFLHANMATVHTALRTHSFTQRFLYTHAFYTETLWHTVAGAFTCKYLHGGVYFVRFLKYIRACSVTGMPLITHAFTQRYFYIETPYTEMLLHRDAFTHRNVFLHPNTFTDRWFYTEQFFTQIPEQTEVLSQRNEFALGVFTYGHFHADILLHDFRRRTRVWCKEFSKHMQNRSFTTGFDGRDAFRGKRVASTHTNIAIWPQCMTIDMSRERVTFHGHQSTPPCARRERLETVKIDCRCL